MSWQLAILALLALVLVAGAVWFERSRPSARVLAAVAALAALGVAGRVALAFGAQKINLHQLGSEFLPGAGQVQAGSGDLCFIVDTPVEEAIEHLQRLRVEVIEGPVTRTGATGEIRSVYFRDPDDNLIEISNYVR